MPVTITIALAIVAFLSAFAFVSVIALKRRLEDTESYLYRITREQNKFNQTSNETFQALCDRQLRLQKAFVEAGYYPPPVGPNTSLQSRPQKNDSTP